MQWATTINNEDKKKKKKKKFELPELKKKKFELPELALGAFPLSPLCTTQGPEPAHRSPSPAHISRMHVLKQTLMDDYFLVGNFINVF